MADILLDVETQRAMSEVPGGWNNIAGFGLAVAVTWDDNAGFRAWREADARSLVGELAAFSRVVGYNLLRFDYTVLSAYHPGIHAQLEAKTVDMLVDLRRRLGFNVPLQSVAQATLGRSKSGDGLASVQWFRAGLVDKVIAYCQEDVTLTRDVYQYGCRKGYVLYLDHGRPAKVLVKWS
jgi:DEAD/DEAH box helicase domain-containing protein